MKYSAPFSPILGNFLSSLACGICGICGMWHVTNDNALVGRSDILQPLSEIIFYRMDKITGISVDNSGIFRVISYNFDHDNCD